MIDGCCGCPSSGTARDRFQCPDNSPVKEVKRNMERAFQRVEEIHERRTGVSCRDGTKGNDDIAQDAYYHVNMTALQGTVKGQLGHHKGNEEHKNYPALSPVAYWLFPDKEIQH